MTRDRPASGGQDSTLEGEFPSDFGGGGKVSPKVTFDPREVSGTVAAMNNTAYGGTKDGLYVGSTYSSALSGASFNIETGTKTRSSIRNTHTFANSGLVRAFLGNLFIHLGNPTATTTISWSHGFYNLPGTSVLTPASEYTLNDYTGATLYNWASGTTQVTTAGDYSPNYDNLSLIPYIPYATYGTGHLGRYGKTFTTFINAVGGTNVSWGTFAIVPDYRGIGYFNSVGSISFS